MRSLLKSAAFWTFLAVIASVLLLVLAERMANAALQVKDERTSLALTKACMYPIGGWTIINCSNAAAAQSAQLVAWSRYVVQCGDDSYLATGDEATDEADANDGWLPAGAWLEFMTTDVVRYLSCKNKNSDSDCRIWECQ